MSKTKLKNAEYSVNEIVKNASYRSYASKNDMRVMLSKCVRDLHDLGFKISHVKGFKPKHVFKLVEHWKEENKSTLHSGLAAQVRRGAAGDRGTAEKDRTREPLHAGLAGKGENKI